jgi:hypothetical protein
LTSAIPRRDDLALRRDHCAVPGKGRPDVTDRPRTLSSPIVNPSSHRFIVVFLTSFVLAIAGTNLELDVIGRFVGRLTGFNIGAPTYRF